MVLQARLRLEEKWRRLGTPPPAGHVYATWQLGDASSRRQGRQHRARRRSGRDSTLFRPFGEERTPVPVAARPIAGRYLSVDDFAHALRVRARYFPETAANASLVQTAVRCSGTNSCQKPGFVSFRSSVE